MKFLIYAVGSNDTLTYEIKNVMDQVLEHSLNVLPCRLDQLASHTDGQLYICNASLKNSVEQYIDSSHIAILNLTPTSMFFLNVRSAPLHSDIYIFNNRSTYCTTLANLCRQMGLADYHYIPLPYEEMDESALTQALQHAEYIIGVNDILNDELLSPKYKRFLLPNVKIIGANRTASVATASDIILQLNRLLFQSCEQHLFQLSSSLQKLQDAGSLYTYYEGIILSLVKLQSNLDQLADDPSQGNENIVVRAAINQIH